MSRQNISLLIFSFFILFSQPQPSFSQNVPESARSRRVTRKMQPILQPQIADSGFQWGAHVFIRIFKESKELELWLQDGGRFRLFKNYHICNWGHGTLGPKLARGDGQAPEGFYFVRPTQLNPNSNFHLAFNIGYPNRYDRAHNRTGGSIMVHGDCCSIGCYAMTDPVIEEIYTIVDAALRHGQPFFRVHIFPFRMTDENLARFQKNTLVNYYLLAKKLPKTLLKYSISAAFNFPGDTDAFVKQIFAEIVSSVHVVKYEVLDFWRNLQQGYLIFEQTHIPPNVNVQNNRYIFN